MGGAEDRFPPSKIRAVAKKIGFPRLPDRPAAKEKCRSSRGASRDGQAPGQTYFRFSTLLRASSGVGWKNRGGFRRRPPFECVFIPQKNVGSDAHAVAPGPGETLSMMGRAARNVSRRSPPRALLPADGTPARTRGCLPECAPGRPRPASAAPVCAARSGRSPCRLAER